jgi:hypothetical protein
MHIQNNIIELKKCNLFSKFFPKFFQFSKIVNQNLSLFDERKILKRKTTI